MHIPFLPGLMTPHPGPLARYLPPLPYGAATKWIQSLSLADSWVLDPFGAAPYLAYEAAQAGCQVLVAANNPILRAMIELIAAPPSQKELRGALAELAGAYKGNQRLEPHILSLYETDCAECGKLIYADYYLWERDADTPYARSYHCPHCGDHGEHPATLIDKERAAQYSSGGLHHSRALERVAPLHDPDREFVAEALDVYPPRAVYALFTLINKLDGLVISPARRAHIRALLLSACDQANALWGYPGGRERPKQLSIPPRFKENNVWLALEQAVTVWQFTHPPVPITIWPQVSSQTGSICIFEGRLKDLASELSQIPFKAALTVLPRPNQAFWSLSALWAGWLWGKDAVAPFKSVLRRRRYDWSWHTTALSAAFRSLCSLLEPGTPLFMLNMETEPSYLTATVIAAVEAGLELEAVALRTEGNQAQLHWRQPQKEHPAESHPYEFAQEKAAEASVAFLHDYAQPCDYLNLHVSALAGLANARAFRFHPKTKQPAEIDALPAEAGSAAALFTQTQSLLRELFSYRAGFLRFEGSQQSREVGLWWLREIEVIPIPLYDRLEVALVRYLLKHSSGASFDDIEATLLADFPALLTPSSELIQVCLESYGEQDPEQKGIWRLRPEDNPSSRQADLKVNRQLIVALGKRLGFSVIEPHQPTTKNQPVWWKSPAGKNYAFYILASARIGEIVLNGKPTTPGLEGETFSLIVLPGGRANLAAHKQEIDPRLKNTLEKGWSFLKYRHLQRLVNNSSLSADNFVQQVGLDPLTYNIPQIRFF